MKEVVQANIATLKKSLKILNELNSVDLSNCGVSPYYSSIGSHLRHIHDFYECIFDGYTDKFVDLTKRKRNKSIENDCDFAILNFEIIISKLNDIEVIPSCQLRVIDDLGQGKIEIQYSFSSLLSQANSHTIHHYAIINYIMDRLKISCSVEDLGYNPSTPKVTI